MKLKDMIDILLQDYSIAIRDYNDNNVVCVTRTHSKGIIPYLNKEVVMWFPSSTLSNPADFTVTLKDI